MENAVQALLIVAGVLIGVMILSLGVSLYSSLNQYVEQSQQEIIDREVQQFNEQFFKYINWDGVSREGGSPKVDFVLTIQDVVTAANAARNNNLEYGISQSEPNNYYVTVNAEQSNLENIVDFDDIQELLTQELDDEITNNYTYTYVCSYGDIEINPITGRVCEVNFTKITP